MKNYDYLYIKSNSLLLMKIIQLIFLLFSIPAEHT